MTELGRATRNRGTGRSQGWDEQHGGGQPAPRPEEASAERSACLARSCTQRSVGTAGCVLSGRLMVDLDPHTRTRRSASRSRPLVGRRSDKRIPPGPEVYGDPKACLTWAVTSPKGPVLVGLLEGVIGSGEEPTGRRFIGGASSMRCPRYDTRSLRSRKLRCHCRLGRTLRVVRSQQLRLNSGDSQFSK
jgi:hypothetical protein